MSVNAYDSAPVEKFLRESNHAILGELAANNQHALEDMQKFAWLEQIALLKRAFVEQMEGWLFLEMQIPRMRKRADAVFLAKSIVFVIEFKVGADKHAASALAQVEDYALDLKNFHEGSHNVPIVPVLVSTEARGGEWELVFAEDQVAKPVRVNGAELGECLRALSEQRSLEALSGDSWRNGGYRPTPTIIQAAQTLYAGHGVKDISRHDSGAKNLQETSETILKAVRNARIEHSKIVCFVTGVPGSGKTLAGLNLATLRSGGDASENAVFLSGNGPLVDVLREALTRDRVRQTGSKRDVAYREVSSFIQNIHHFRGEYLKDEKSPSDHVVIFDEAQRAWNQREVSKFMLRKKGIANLGMSEPEFLLRTMDQSRRLVRRYLSDWRRTGDQHGRGGYLGMDQCLGDQAAGLESLCFATHRVAGIRSA